jgi:hypothetical protein
MRTSTAGSTGPGVSSLSAPRDCSGGPLGGHRSWRAASHGPRRPASRHVPRLGVHDAQQAFAEKERAVLRLVQLSSEGYLRRAALECRFRGGAGISGWASARRLYERGDVVKSGLGAGGQGPRAGLWWGAALMSLAPRGSGIVRNGRARSGGAIPLRAVRRLDENRRLPERRAGCG